MSFPGLLHRSFCLLVLLLPLACGGDEAASDLGVPREEAFEVLGLPYDSEAELDRSFVRLEDVELFAPPVIGRDYYPEFPEPIEFRPEEWLTNEGSESVADPRAVPGGRIRLATLDWPNTLRTEGPNSRAAFLSDIHSLMYETLVGYDYVLNDYVPGLASHWWVGEDQRTYRFRIDERAQWADGRPVTADDVVATVEHLKNPDRKDAFAYVWRDRIESARMLDRQTVEIRAKHPEWRSLLQIGAGILIYPAAYIRMDGETYLSEWNWKLPPGSGPYELRPEDVKRGRSLTLRRRGDWWGRELPRYEGMLNFDAIVWQIVRDQELMYQKFLAGELDLYQVSRAQRWVTELDSEEKIRQGWIQRRKIYNLNPEGFGGYLFNLRRPPFDDVRVRKAFAHLFNREKLFRRFFFFQYEMMESYFPGQDFARPGAEPIPYDPAEARRLLAEAGWTNRDAAGRLVNESGDLFPELYLGFAFSGWQRIHDVFRASLWEEAGVRLKLELVDSATLTKNIWEHQFQITWWNWTGQSFPDPRGMWHSEFAERKQSNNLGGFAKPEVDRLIAEYVIEWDAEKRIELLQELDRILFEDHPYALSWYAPFFRILYWDSFGHPPEYASRHGRDINNILWYWWFDPDRAETTRENMRANRPNYPDRPHHQADEIEVPWWMDNETPMPDDHVGR